MAPEPTSSGRERPLTVDDLLRLEELGEVALSPDGQWLAYVVRRARRSARFHKYEHMAGGDRGDVWLLDTTGGLPQNLTRGEEDGSGYWAPIWSTDSARLAMLSTKGGNIHVWGCEVASKNLVRLCERPVDYTDRHPHLWVSDRKLLIVTLPAGERSLRMTVEIQAAEIATREWPKTWRGRESTASALDSGAHAPFSARPQGELRLVDAASGLEQTVTTGFFRDLRIAPDRRHVALLRQVEVVRPEAGRALDRGGSERQRLAIVTTDGEVVTGALEQLEAPLSGSVRWSSNSEEFALIARSEARSPLRVFRYRLASGRLEPVTGLEIEPTSIAWTAGGEILVLAKTAHGHSEGNLGRADWWLFGRESEPRNLSGDLASFPARLIREAIGDAFVGYAGGHIMRLCVADGRWENLTADLKTGVGWLVWPSASTSDGESFNELVVAVVEGASPEWRRLDLRTGQLTRLSLRPAAESRLHFWPGHDTAVHVAADRTGARLWHSKPAVEQPTVVHETNTWLPGIAEGEVRRVAYRGLEDNDLAGWLILPVDYERGSRCPLITCVLPGLVFGGPARPTFMVSICGHHAFNLQLLAARGYAVLIPSMPMAPEGKPSDPYLELTKGVLPAVDSVIESGVADPARLGVMGQSRGGYGTYGLITQTSRFSAAVALAGYADLVSLYGQFDARFRYDQHAHEQVGRMFLAESGPSQHRMGAPPWEDSQRYIRNSPIFQVDQVETPVLIIQGDLDYVSLQQGEQFFSALYRQGKRARFVRYWGEGHVFQSPANVENMWNEIYGWFEEFLVPSTDRNQLKS